MKFFATSSIRQLDQYTIEHEPIASIDLMERAVRKIYLEVLRRVESDRPIMVFAGPRNNGGDALALARMLLQSTFSVQVVLLHTGKLSTDCETNRQRLLDKFSTTLNEQTDRFETPTITANTVIIDGLFGSGLTRPLSGIFTDAVKWINESNCTVISIDIPSGLQEEIPPSKGEQDIIIKANSTFSFQFPKLAFLFPENENFVGEWEVLDIGIHPKAIEETTSAYYYLEKSDIQSILKPWQKFSHKGTFGHALVIAGSKDMAGAAVLSAKSALRAGAGLVSVQSAAVNRIIIQTAIPEAIFISDKSDDCITQINTPEKYKTIAIGPGIGTQPATAAMLETLLRKLDKPCILDADALNIISLQHYLLEFIPKNSILTPHPKEFERIFGKCNNSFERMQKASEAAQRFSVYIVLKGAHTLIATPDGKLFFNSTGNPGMATAGSGDVLTGILAGLLAQGYTPEETAKLGVFIHGMAGDLAAKTESEESLIASDIIGQLGATFQLLKM